MNEEEEKTVIEIHQQGLDNFLIQHGVSRKTIEDNKVEKAKKIPEEYKIYYDYKKTVNNVIIPVSKIKGVSRVSGYSWFELLNACVLRVPIDQGKRLNLDPRKFLSLLNLIKNRNSKNLNEIYLNFDYINFSCYKREMHSDYYVSGQGNHRTITAKNFGVEFLKVSRVHYYEFNDDKYQEYQLYQAKKQEFGKLLARLGLFVDFYGCISFQINDSVITITDYPFENLVDGHRPISEMIGTADLLTPILEEVKNFSERFQQRYRHYPTVLKHFLYQQLQNNEIRIEEQDFAKKMGRCIALKRVNN